MTSTIAVTRLTPVANKRRIRRLLIGQRLSKLERLPALCKAVSAGSVNLSSSADLLVPEGGISLAMPQHLTAQATISFVGIFQVFSQTREPFRPRGKVPHPEKRASITSQVTDEP